MKTKLFSLFVVVLITTNVAFAADCYIDGIWYDLYGDEATVTCDNIEYTGHKTIPSSITYQYKTYRVVAIAPSAFKDCPKLTGVTIGNSVTTIGYSAFENCPKLTSVTIPNSVTEIGFSAFEDCPKLTSVTIPNSVTKIGSSAFSGCSGLTSITIPNSVTTIGSFAFSKCSGLTSITIPNSVTTIGEDAFSECWGLTSITIPNSVTTIGKEAFSYSGLTSVTIPNSVTTIGDLAFNDCTSLTKTNYTGTIADWCKIKFGCISSNPIFYSENFFINDVEVKDLVIPEGVEAIGDYAFYHCSGLTSVTIPNSVTKIGDSAFDGCTGMTSVTIGNSVTTIGYRTFYWCKSLTSVTIPNSVTKIEEDAFSECSGLTSVTIPNSVTSIGSAFYGCSGLTSVTIPNSVTTIGSSAFYKCSGLTSITIPNSVTSIGSYAFFGCSGLTSITCETTTPPTCGARCFYNVDKSIPVYVPVESVEAYKSVEQWKDFTDIRPITAQEVEVTEIEAEPTESTVEIAWRAVENAYNYIIVIKQGEDTICKMTFNAEGQLVTSQYYAPQRAQLLTSTTDAEQTATGWRYVIRDLEPGTEYTYSIVAYDETDKAIDSQSGTFRTLLPSGLEDLTIDKNVGNKFIYGNQLYIRRGYNLYTATGAKVK